MVGSRSQREGDQHVVHGRSPEREIVTPFASTPAGPATVREAATLDAADPLGRFRDRFHVPPGQVYLQGNGLGLLSRDAERAVLDTLEEWKRLAHMGWTDASPPWMDMAEDVGALMAPLVGAAADEVIATGATTENIHTLVATFYRPAGRRTKILADELTFPSDLFALQSQVRLRGGDPAEGLVLVRSRDGRTIDEDDVIAAMTDEIAIAVLPVVLYRSGQLLDVARVTRAAHERGILIGFDAAHSIGVLPHRFDEWGVDFGLWSGYKYLNGGPGAVAGLYVNRRHFGTPLGLAGWFGTDPAWQFDPTIEFHPAGTARAWSISSPHVLSAAALRGSLAIFAEAGMDAIREKSVHQTSYLIELLDERLVGAGLGWALGSPRDPARRGGHIVVEHAEAARVHKAVRAAGFNVGYKPPHAIRIAPSPLYTRYLELAQVIEALADATGHSDDPPPR
jgi:kynureninase